MMKDSFVMRNGHKVNWFTKAARGSGFALAALAIAAPASAGQRTKLAEFTFDVPSGSTLNRFLLTEACPNVGTPPPYDLGRATEISSGRFRADFTSNTADDTCVYTVAAELNTGLSPSSAPFNFKYPDVALIDRTNDYGKIGIIAQDNTDQITNATPWGPFATWSLLKSGTNNDGTGWGVLMTADKRQIQVWHSNTQGVLQLPLGQIYTPANVGSEAPVVIDVERKLDGSGFHVLSVTPNRNSQSSVLEDISNTAVPVANTKRVIAAETDTANGKTRRWASASISVNKVSGNIQLLRAGRPALGTEPTAIGDYYGKILTLNPVSKATISTKNYPTGETYVLPWDILCNDFGKCRVTSIQETGGGGDTGRRVFESVDQNMNVIANTKNQIGTLSFPKQDGSGLAYFLPQRPLDMGNDMALYAYIRDPGLCIDGYDGPAIFVPVNANNQFVKPVGSQLFQLAVPAAGYKAREVNVVAGNQLTVSYVKKDGSGDKQLEIYSPWSAATQSFTKVRTMQFTTAANAWTLLSNFRPEDTSSMVAGVTSSFKTPVVPQRKENYMPLIQPNQG